MIFPSFLLYLVYHKINQENITFDIFYRWAYNKYKNECLYNWVMCMDRTVLHVDMNNFYASVECLYHPEIRHKPVAVVGDAEKRHGIILAKNQIAKAAGVATGNPLWMAKQKCPEIVFVEANFDLYLKFSRMAREIYEQYTNRIEPFGIDESWLDVTGSQTLFGSGKTIADEIRRRVRFELGVTVSVGVSFNKVFAKLGSDYQKPDATTVITRKNYKEVVHPLPVSDLLYIGSATKQKLHQYGIDTIGDLAGRDVRFLQRILGKNGVMLWLFANGKDTAPVAEAKPAVKSIGNSITVPRDLVTEEDVKIVLYVLCESVATRLKEQSVVCRTVQVYLRDTALYGFERQCKAEQRTDLSQTIFEAAFALYRRHHTSAKPLRSIGVRACNLEPDTVEQLSFLPEAVKREKQRKLECTIEEIRRRFGHHSVKRAIMLRDEALSGFNPKEGHIIHPEAFLR